MADKVYVGLSFEFHEPEQCLVVYQKLEDGTREPTAHLYSQYDVDLFALQLEVYAAEIRAFKLDEVVFSLRLVAANRW